MNLSNREKISSRLIVIYIYASSISLLFSIWISDFLVKNVIILLLIFISLITNKFKFNKMFLYYITGIVIFTLINALLVDIPLYPVGDGLNLLFYSFIPLYLASINSIKINIFIEEWYKFAVFFSILMPIYYLLRTSYIITYYEIGLLAYYNFLSLIIYSFTRKSKKVWILALINLSILAIFGSRMVLLAAFLTTFVALLLLSSKKKIMYYFKILLLFILSGLLYINLLSILTSINSMLVERGINSRNLMLFIQQINGTASSDSILSGRQEIYPLVISFIRENGFFPSGFGVARFLTNGKYYHSHNFFTELILIFGFSGVLLLMSLAFARVYTIRKNNIKNTDYLDYKIAFLIFISFLFRSITGTHFVSDVMFLLSVALFIKPQRLERKQKLNGVTKIYESNIY